MAESVFGTTFANLANASARVQFELQFNQIQNTLIRRFNDQVDDIEADSGALREIERLQKESVKLVDSLPVIEAYRQGNSNNAGALDAIIDEFTTLEKTINQDANVTAEEVTAFETQRDIVATKLDNLYIFVHPDINDGNIILKLKEDIDTLRALTPVVGALDDSGTNSNVTSTVATLKSKTETALASTQLTVATALDLEQKIQADFSSRQAELLDLTAVEQARRNEEIEDLRVETANLLRIISLSFEANANFADYVTGGLSAKKPAPGSILNLFT